MASQWQDDERLRTWRLFLEAHTRVIRRLDIELQESHDLPIEWYDVLVQLQEAGGRRTMGNLAGALLISPSNCSRLVDRLVAEGFVRRESDDDDGRVKHAVLTNEGFDALKSAAPTHLDGVERYFTQFLGPVNAGAAQFYRDVLAALDAPVENRPGRGGGT